MKTWNAPELKELKLSGTELHGTDVQYVDGAIYDAERDTNWYTYSGGNPNTSEQPGDVILH